MRRPRLVEEGVPIGSSYRKSGSSAEEEPDDAPMLTENAGLLSEPQSHLLAPAIGTGGTIPSSTMNRSSNATKNPAAKPQQSSLLRAAGGTIAPTIRRTTIVPSRPTTFQIGGDDEGTLGHGIDDEDDSGMMEEDHDNDPHKTARSNSTQKTPHSSSLHNNFATHESNVSIHQNQRQNQAMMTPYTQSTSAITRTTTPVSSSTVRRTHIEIGADYRVTEKMEGVEDHSVKTPMVVLDGANVAYAYAQSFRDSSNVQQQQRLEPDVRGLKIATSYFSATDLRVLIVLPQSFLRRRHVHSNASSMITSDLHDREQQSILEELQQEGKLVAAPPADDDDAYALHIAQRENTRAAQRQGWQGLAYVLSNDMFRDAQQRDSSDHLRKWLNEGVSTTLGPGRISYTFGDMARMDSHGDRILDFIPNPRHPLVQWVEQQHGLSAGS